jgi:ADP-ribose pyrophosphatase
MEVLMECPSSAGLTDEIISFVKATGLRRVGPGGGDASENILVHLIPLSQAAGWLLAKRAEGIALDPKIFAALYWLGTA